MKDLPGWLKTASLQRCERTPPLPRFTNFFGRISALKTSASASLSSKSASLSPEASRMTSRHMPTPPPRRRRSETSLSSSMSINSVMGSPIVTPRRKRRQLTSNHPDVVRKSVSLHCLSIKLDENSSKPLLPPKVSIGSRSKLNVFEEKVRCVLRF